MRSTVGLAFALSFTSFLGGCRIDPPPIDPAAPPGAVADGPRFFARTAGGEQRPLTLRQLSVEVETKPGTVRSHLTMEIAGPPAGDKLEAVIRMAIPRGAAVTGAVLWVDGRPMNGAFVERERAREVYRSIVARRRDPALVTWDGPGWVSVSIFPLDRGEPRRFELEWVEPAAIAAGYVQYRAPTVAEGGRMLGRASVTIGGRRLPVGELVPLEPVPAGAAEIVDGHSPGDPFHRILVSAPPAAGPPRVILVAEISVAVTAGERIGERTVLDTVLDALPPDARVTIVGADWDLSVIAEEVDPAEARRDLSKLDAIPSAGALHLERALADAAARARKTEAGAVLFVGHGVDAFWGDAVASPLEKLRVAGAQLSVIGVGEASPALSDAAALTGGETLSAAESADVRGRIVRALAPRPARPTLVARGLNDWWPLETITGQTVWMGRALEAPKVLPGAGAPIASTEMTDLLPLWDRARLFTSGRRGHAGGEATLPLALTPLRALLVLETGEDYALFGLERPESPGGHRATAESGSTEGKLGRRTSPAREGLYGLLGARDNPDPALARALAQEQAKNAEVLGRLRGDGYGVGGLGAVGTAGTGAGIGEGTIAIGNDHAQVRGVGQLGRASDVLPGPPVYDGPGVAAAVIVGRAVRRHINEVRWCYEQGLAKTPGLGGRVVVKLVIGTRGDVDAALESSTVRDRLVTECIVSAAGRWTFPHLATGPIVLSYPFVLQPGDTPPAPPAPIDEDAAATAALGILAGPGTLVDRVQRVASRLGVDGSSDPESLAWTLDRRGASRTRIILIARLLVASQRRRDAVRILSEHAPRDREAIGAEMRRMGADADAAELLSLAGRSP